MSNLKDVYKIRLRCSVCGDSGCFEYNDDKTYIKCVRCGKEYLGGYDELVEENKKYIDSLKEAISKSDVFLKELTYDETLQEEDKNAIINGIGKYLNDFVETKGAFRR